MTDDLCAATKFPRTLADLEEIEAAASQCEHVPLFSIDRDGEHPPLDVIQEQMIELKLGSFDSDGRHVARILMRALDDPSSRTCADVATGVRLVLHGR
ncbi:hypothetical protein [Cellulomonas sp. URHE0023]|uniref:hypothetical protein n=1 Tax=Cellulomonas sp. URHE0023 TaxID=1380354 RepID=UPI0004867226|nr:hypothetical protein [Cellulomonas sp. URHE0023]